MVTSWWGRAREAAGAGRIPWALWSTPSPCAAPGGVGSARAPSVPTACPRCRVASPSRPTSGADGMRWGATLRSPHPYARIVGHRPVTGRGASPASRPSSPPTTCPAGSPTGSSRQDQPVFARDVGALRGRARRRGGRRPPRDVPAGAGRHRRRLRGARAADRPGGGGRRRARADPPRRQRAAPPADRARRRRRHRAESWWRAPTRSACRTRRSWASRRRWRCPTRAVPASSCSSPPSGCTRTASRWPPASASSPRTRCASTLGGVGGAFGAREDISLQVHCCLLRSAHRPAREDAVRPGGELLRPRAPAPGHDLDAPPRHRRRPHREDRGPLRARRRRLRVHVVGGARATPSPTPRARTCARTPSWTGGRRAPTTRRAGPCAASAWCRPASPTRARWTSWPRRAASTRSRSASATPCAPATGSSRVRSCESVAPVARCIRETAALPMPDRAGRGLRRRPAAAARRRRAHRRREPRAPGCRLRRGHQEPHVLRGLRRLLHRPLPAGRRRGHA